MSEAEQSWREFQSQGWDEMTDPAESPSPDRIEQIKQRVSLVWHVGLDDQAEHDIVFLLAELATVKAERDEIERELHHVLDSHPDAVLREVAAERDRLQQENREQQFAICSAAQSRNELEAALGVATERIQAAHSTLTALQTLAEEWENRQTVGAGYFVCAKQLRERLSTATTKGTP